MRYLRYLALPLIAALVLTSAGCATATSASSLTRLENARTANPSSVAALRALGIAYYKRQRFADARSVLDAARKLDPKDGVTALYAGLSAEALEDYAGAKDAYNTYIQVGKTRSVRNDIRARLVALSRTELHAAAKSAIANEVRIAAEANDPRAVAVLPMTFSGTDQSLAPLSRGMSDLLINDLARAPELRLLERDRVQAMIDEIALSKSGATDAATSLRAGKLVRASKVVQGAITQTGARNLTVNAAIVAVATSQQQGKDVQSSDVLEQIFTIEKNIALGLFNELGVRLSAADRAALEQRPTRSLQAFLAYSNGLVAEDEGRYGDAARFYDQARSIDPGFSAALQKSQSAKSAQQGSQVTAAKVESGLKSSAEGATVDAAERGVSASSSTGVGSTLASAVGDINPSAANSVNTNTGGTTGQQQPQTPPTTRDAAAEKTGTDQPAQKTGQVTIVIRKP
ncbi:MAG: tetratricopeptide repeat protein [Gemmatimonadota bacterium]|nr:tetratricopeptide repeat protein [Gemmatimonadota bacterium]